MLPELVLLFNSSSLSQSNLLQITDFLSKVIFSSVGLLFTSTQTSLKVTDLEKPINNCKNS